VHTLHVDSLTWDFKVNGNDRQHTNWGTACVADFANERWVMFGGEGHTLNPLYNMNPYTVILDWGCGWNFGSSWSLTETGQPSTRVNAAMIYVQSTQKIYMAFGAGNVDPEAGRRLVRRDLWEFNCQTDTWTELVPDTGIQGEQSSYFLQNAAFSEPVILVPAGGCLAYGPVDPNDHSYFALELNTSTNQFTRILDAEGDKPTAELDPCIVWDPVREKGYLWYGNSDYWGGTNIPETWEFWFAIPEPPDTAPPEFSQGFGVNVSDINSVDTPKARTAWNQFDEHGLLVGLTRLKGEHNWQFRRRISDALVHAANSAYQGMVYGMTRELGLSLSYPLVVNPKRSQNGSFLAPDPYILFDGVWLYLYSDYANGLLDFQIDRHRAGNNYEHLNQLVDLINTTAFFEAELTATEHQYVRSMAVLNQSNRLMLTEPVQPSTRFKLRYPYVVPGSVYFSDLHVFASRKIGAAAVTNVGDFHIDYQKGIVTVYTVPSVEAFVRYQYVPYPFKPVASPVVLHDINQDNFRVKMFEQILQDDGTYEHGLPTELGVDVINELMSVKPMYWGV
jgi:hypothetical protein